MTTNIDTIKMLLSKDKRKTERLLLSLDIYYSSENTDWIGPVAVTNISGGGLQFTNDQRIKNQTKLNFKIHLPNEAKPIKVTGEVSWCKNITSKNDKNKTDQQLYTISVKFQKIAAGDKQRFINFICENILMGYLDTQGNLKSQWT